MNYRILQGDVIEQICTLPDESVNCVVTSPPYWGLRDYGVAGQIGLESTPDEFVARMVEVFREVRRVLRSDGTCWINLGDSYAGSWGAQSREHAGKHAPNVSAISANQIKAAQIRGSKTGSLERTPGLKPKDLCGIPWRVAFALQADGWWLRGDHVWGKPNGMPESVTDCPTRSHEYVFLLTKSERYWYDAEAVRTAPKASAETRLKQDIESQSGSTRANAGGKTNGTMKAVRRDKQRGHSRRHKGFNDRWDAMSHDDQCADGANLRSIWWISPAQYSEAHFAVMPDLLAAICILAGSPEGGTVFDPFSGSGTTGLVALRHGRNYLGCELNPEYVEMSHRRIQGDAPLLNTEVTA